MKDTLSNFIIFATGAAIGSVVTWKLVKSKYEQIAQEEIESVKEVFARRDKKVEEEPVEPIESVPKKEPEGHAGTLIRKMYGDLLKKSNYTSYSDIGEQKEEASNVDAPYVIPPEEYGEKDYETISLVYYADGVLADDKNDLVEDADDSVGEFSSHFGEYEDDSVFVRNDGLKVDYEILLDPRNYSDVIDEKIPHRAEDE